MLMLLRKPENTNVSFTGAPRNTVGNLPANRKDFIMKTHILAGLIITGALAVSVAQASTLDEIYSGMSAAAIQKDQQANPAAERHSTAKTTCTWREGKDDSNPLFAAYPGDEYAEKAYLNPVNQRFVC